MRDVIFVGAFLVLTLTGCAGLKDGWTRANTPDPVTGIVPTQQLGAGAIKVAMSPTSVDAWTTFIEGAATVVGALLGGAAIKKGVAGYHDNIAGAAAEAVMDKVSAISTPVTPPKTP